MDIKRKPISILPIVLILLLIATPLVYLKIKHPTASPFTSAFYIYGSFRNPHANMTKQIIGFIPYWRASDIQYIRFDLTSEVIFFSLTADENGDIVKVVGNETEPGWRWWNSQTIKDLIAKTQISGDKFGLSIAMQKNDVLENFLNNKTAQENLTANLLKIIKDRRLDGLNIDFEYSGELSDELLRDKFTQFTGLLTSELRSNSPGIELTVDLFPLSVEKPRLFDVNKLADLFDKLIVMSYSYYGASSDIAGPGAPMGGYKEGKYFFDVSTTYSDYLTIISKEKIIMGVGYYAWDYPVEDGSLPMSKVLPGSNENGYPSVMTYGRMRTVAEINPKNCTWDDLAQENWCLYQDALTGKTHQVWIEDNKSIGTKFYFAQKNGLAGVAIWTLGYDKPYPDIWNMINDVFSSKTTTNTTK